MPGFIKPQLATLRSTAPKGDQWLHEIKFDGYRVQVHVNSGRKKVYTRTGLTGPNASPPLLLLSTFPGKPSSMGK
jgi:ATP-dependent DNA ligase